MLVEEHSLPFHVFLNDFFGKLDGKNIRYCIFSGHEHLPEAFLAEDIDIIISGEDLREAGSILESVFRSHGAECFALHKFKGRDTYLFFFIRKEGPAWASIKVDLFCNFEFRGRVFLPAGEVLDNVIPHKGFSIPCVTHQAYIGVVKGLMKGGSAWGKYLPRIRAGMAQDPAGMESLLQRIFRKRTARDILSRLDSGDIEGIEKDRRRLIRATYVNSLLRHPLRFPLNLIAYIFVRIGHHLNPPCYMLAVLGPDGVGKSTLIGRVKTQFQDIFKVSDEGVKVFHIRPGLFPTVTEMLKKKKRPSDSPSRLEKTWQAPSKAISLVRLLCFWTDYFLGYLVKILPELGKYHVIVLDRYYFDLLIDPARYKIDLPHWVMKAFFAALPKPRITIVLDAPAETIFRRKGELNEEKIGKLLHEYRNLRFEIANLHVLDATNPPEKLSFDVVSKCMKNFATGMR